MRPANLSNMTMDRVSPAKTQLVIFDCDGVLIDSEGISSRTLSEALNREGVAISPDEVYRTITGMSESMIKTELAARYGLTDVANMFRTWHAEIYQAFSNELLPVDGIEDVVRGLNLPVCVASNSLVERLEKSLGLLALWDAFAPHVYSAEMVPLPKPAPDLLLHCVKQFDADPSACIMIDDGVHGIEAARAAGLLSIGFVAPNDPRSGRREALAEAGATRVASGSAELAHHLSELTG